VHFLEIFNRIFTSLAFQVPPAVIYFLVGLLAFLECAALLGTVVPGETFVILAGLLSSKKIIDVNILFQVVFVSAVLGDAFGFFLGRRFGLSLFNKVRRYLRIPEEYLSETQKFFEKYGVKTVVIARFVGFLRAATPFLAGTASVRFREFLFFDIIGALLWSAALCYGSFYLGEGIYVIERYLGRASLIVILIIAGGFLGRSLIKRAFLKIEEVRQRFFAELLFSLWFLVSAGLLFYLSLEAREADINFEMKILNFIIQHRSSWLTLISGILTSFGSGYFVSFLTIASLIIFLIRKRTLDALLFFAAVVSSNIFGFLLKLLLRTERPEVPLVSIPQEGYSFPSGHVTASSLIFWVLGWIILREGRGAARIAAIIMFLVPVGVGFSRMYLGYHWPIDVLGGYALSFMVFSAWVFIYEKLKLRGKASDDG
jgi:undecaprenyl-diphosphatase